MGWNCGEGPKQEDFARYLIFPLQNVTLQSISPLEHSGQSLCFLNQKTPTWGHLVLRFPLNKLTNTRYIIYGDLFFRRNENTKVLFWKHKTFDISHKSASCSHDYLLRSQCNSYTSYNANSFLHSQLNLSHKGNQMCFLPFPLSHGSSWDLSSRL